MTSAEHSNMAAFVFIIIVSVVIGMNFVTNPTERSLYRDGTLDNFKEPVARSYPILYWSAVLHVLLNGVVFVWRMIFTRPWERYTPQYVAPYHLHHTPHYLQMQDILFITAFFAVFLLLYAYSILSKRIKGVIFVIWIFIALDLLHVLYDYRLATYQFAIDVVAVGFNFLVVWSLTVREKDFLKMLRTLGRRF